MSFRFLCLTPVVERFFSTPLRVVKNQWVGRKGGVLKCERCGQTVSSWNLKFEIHETHSTLKSG